MEYIPTTTLIRSIKDQLSEQLAEHANRVMYFEGDLYEAVMAQFGQATTSSIKSAVIFGLSDDIPSAISGSGAALRSRLFVDFYVIVRNDGKSRRDDDIDRMLRISDVIFHEAFDYPNTSEPFREAIASAEVQFRRRYNTGDVSYYAHVIRFAFQAHRPK